MRTPRLLCSLMAIVLLGLIVAACSAPAQLTPFVPSPGRTGEAAIVTPSSLPAQTAEAPRTQAARMATASPTAVAAVATLSPERALEAFSALVQGESGCELPCWLDVLPGTTPVIDVRTRFAPFESIALTQFSPAMAYFRSEYVEERGYMLARFPTYSISTTVYPHADSRAARIQVDASVGPARDGTQDHTDPAFRAMLHRFLLPQVLETHGEPGLILLDTADPPPIFGYVIWIVYPERGFWVRYEGTDKIVADLVRMCPLESATISLEMWDPKVSTYHELIEGEGASAFSLGPQPLESKTNLDTASFFLRFMDATAKPCIDSPAALWPDAS